MQKVRTDNQCPKCQADLIATLKDGRFYCLDCQHTWGGETSTSGFVSIRGLITSGYVHSVRTAFYKIERYGIPTASNGHATLVSIADAEKMRPRYWSIANIDGDIKVTTTLAHELTGYTKEALNKLVREQVVSGLPLMSGHQWVDWTALVDYLVKPRSQQDGGHTRLSK